MRSTSVWYSKSMLKPFTSCKMLEVGLSVRNGDMNDLYLAFRATAAMYFIIAVMFGAKRGPQDS